jgi:hypothetical protein
MYSPSPADTFSLLRLQPTQEDQAQQPRFPLEIQELIVGNLDDLPSLLIVSLLSRKVNQYVWSVIFRNIRIATLPRLLQFADLLSLQCSIPTDIETLVIGFTIPQRADISGVSHTIWEVALHFRKI